MHVKYTHSRRASKTSTESNHVGVHISSPWQVMVRRGEQCSFGMSGGNVCKGQRAHQQQCVLWLPDWVRFL